MNYNAQKLIYTKSGSRHTAHNAIDIVKFICAALVVTIHVPPFSDINWVLNFAAVNFAARVAVPFFFVSSAYFVFLKAFDESSGTFGINTGVLLKNAARVFRLYAVWSLIYLPFSYLNMRAVSESMSIAGFIKYYLKDFLFSTGYGHLWYLCAVAWSYLALALLLKAKIKPSVIAAFAFIMYLLGLTTQSWYGLFAPILSTEPVQAVIIPLKVIFKTARGALCEGLLFTLIGMFFAKYEMRISQKCAYICLAVSSVLYAAEVFTLAKLGYSREYDMYLGLITTVFFMFYICINTELPESPVYKKFRTSSALVYFSHMLFAECLMRIPRLEKIFSTSFSQYLFTYICSLCLSLIIIKLSEKLPLLKRLYR